MGIVVDRNFGERLRTLSGLKAVWVIESPLNTPVCASVWQEEGLAGGLTRFNFDGTESAEEACLRIADTVDEHHGASARGGPWMEIQVIGTPLDSELEELFRDLGATAFVPSPTGFTCTRVLPTTSEELLTALTEALAAKEVSVPAAPAARTMEAIARTREARALFLPLSALPLSAPEASYLSERLWQLDTLFQGQPIVFTGPVDAGRETSFLSALTALPGALGNRHATKALILSERARPYDPRWTVLLLGPELSLGQALRSTLRETSHLLFAETVRTDEELKQLLESASAGQGVLYGVDAPPDEALARMEAVVPGIVHSPLFVHHTRDAMSGARSAALYVRDPARPPGAPRVIRWNSGD